MMKNYVTETSDQFADRIAKEFGYGECDWLRKMIAERDAATRRDALAESGAALRAAYWAIESLDDDDLGWAGHNEEDGPWPIKRELLHKLEKAIGEDMRVRAAQQPCPARREDAGR